MIPINIPSSVSLHQHFLSSQMTYPVFRKLIDDFSEIVSDFSKFCLNMSRLQCIHTDQNKITTKFQIFLAGLQAVKEQANA
jgi:hypothetical protein